MRITCVICLPDCFTSEVCLYFDADYLAAQIAVSTSEYGSSEALDGRSLASEWGLVVPPWMKERGRSLVIEPQEADDWSLSAERWCFCEV